MRLSPLAILAGALAFLPGSLSARNSASKEPTTFNGLTVPPLLELTPSNIDEHLKSTKFLFVKHYSPYCQHCIDFAPNFQTLYEFYYTSTPSGSSSSFTDYYDFKFATINCIAYYDMCVNHGVQSYPMTILYKNGQAVDSIRGVKSIGDLSAAIETALEEDKPGSRPANLALPERGATEFHPGAASSGGDDGTLSSDGSGRINDGSVAGQEALSNLHDESAEIPVKKSTDQQAAKEADSPVKKAEEQQKPIKEADLPAKQSSNKDTTDSDKTTPSKSESKWKVPTSAELFNARKPKQPTTPPNPNGVSVSLTGESFQRLVTMTQDPWFIKFYAPWCPHCQAMAPTWDQLAKTMRGKLNVGEVNCDKESRLCKDVHARAYPTILFFKGGERSEYHGLRGLGDFVHYAENAIDLAAGVPDVDAEAFEALEKKEDVIFTYFYDHATTTEDFLALERIPLSLIGHAKLVKTNDPVLFDRFKITTWPRLIVSREGRPTYYTPLTPNEMRDVHKVLDWMKSVWLPLVPELTATNARQIMDGKIVVLAILNQNDQEGYQSALREVKNAATEWMDRQVQEFQLERKKLRDAKQMRIEEAEDRNDERALRAAKTIRIDMDQSGRKEVGFAWVDGVFWQRWIRQTYGVDVNDGERVIINEQDLGRYWDQTVTGNYIMVSRTAISESLDKIVYGPHVIKPKLTINIFAKMWLDLKVTFSDHPYLSGGCVAGILFGLFSWYRSNSRRRNPYFTLDDTMGIGQQLKDGLLGAQNGNAKAD